MNQLTEFTCVSVHPREVFHIKEPQCVVSYFECPVSSYLFRVIDNDTNSEVPRVFHNTPPCIYQPNARGYTFQAEAWNNSTEGILSEEGRWSLRIVSSNRDLPEMEGEVTNEEVASTFYSKEVVDYCLPDRDGSIFRYKNTLILLPIFNYYPPFVWLQIFPEGDTRLSS